MRGPKVTEKFEFTDKEQAKETAMTTLNRMGNKACALIRVGDDWFQYSLVNRTRSSPGTKFYVRKNLAYHPMMHLLS